MARRLEVECGRMMWSWLRDASIREAVSCSFSRMGEAEDAVEMYPFIISVRRKTENLFERSSSTAVRSFP